MARYYDDDDYFDSEDCFGNRIDFADPGGNSALRASSRSNPRNLPCPTCHAPNRLTPADRAQGYQCDGCADRALAERIVAFLNSSEPSAAERLYEAHVDAEQAA